MNESLFPGLIILALFTIIRIAADRFDRERIQAYVEHEGGVLIDIVWNPFGTGWFGSRERIYDVEYRTRDGKTVTATCKTSLWAGVYWTSGTLPSGFTETSNEPTECMSCGATIPARKNRCPQCGWSYKDI